MNIVITGVSSGIGYDLLSSFLEEEGHRIVGLSRAAQTFPFKPGHYREQCKLINVDLAVLDTDREESLLAAVKSELSHIDVLVNNAGLLINKPFKDLTIEDWKLQFAVNLFGMTRLIKLLLPLMGGLKETHIVNLGSMGGFQGSKKFTGLSAYSASKAAVANLTECLAYEFSADNIRVNCLALGAVDTEMLKQAFPGYRAPVTSYEMAEFIKSFCKTGHKLFNGKVLPVSVIDPV